MDKRAFWSILIPYALLFVIYWFVPPWLMAYHWQPTPDIHVHHFFYGVVGVTIIAGIRIIYPNLNKNWLAIMYGISSFYLLDESAMLFKFRDDPASFADYLGTIIFLAALLFLYVFEMFKKSR